MYFRQLLHDERSCASYIVGCPSLGVTAVIDPQPEVELYRRVTRRAGLQITHVIDTHIHADHYSGALALAAATGASLYMHESSRVGFPFEPLSDGDVFSIGNRRFRVLHVPGHAPEHVAFVVDDWFVLTGDTLFVGEVGRVDLALERTDDDEVRIRAEALHASLRRLLDLPDHFEVYPGHYAGSSCGRGMDGKPSSTIGRERRVNAALKLDVDAFVAYQLDNVPPVPEDFRTIKETNAAGGGREVPRQVRARVAP